MEIPQAKKQEVSENPFYGLRNLLVLNKYYEKVVDTNTNEGEINRLLHAAWQEAETSGEKAKQLFFIIVFSGGDIANREHNMFGKIKVDQGGQAKRKAFRLSLKWILCNQASYFYKFLPIIAEYTNYENLWYNQIRTDRNKGTLLSTERLPISPLKVVEYLREKLLDTTTTPFELQCIAKFLPKVPQTKRWRKDKEGKSVVIPKKTHTLEKDRVNLALIQNLSGAMGWKTIVYPKMVRFKGYEEFRSQHLSTSEAHLFSTKKITLMDDIQFQTWLETLPAGARYRVQCRLLTKEGTTLKSKGVWKTSTGSDMGVVYQDWMLNKEIAMKKLTSLSDEEKKNMGKEELKALTKQAATTTGANSVFDVFADLYRSCNGRVDPSNITPETNVLLQTLIGKIKLDVPLMVCIDVSGSMGSKVNCAGIYMDRRNVANMMAAIALYKNPKPELGNTIISFDGKATVYSDGVAFKENWYANKFLMPTTKDGKLDKLCDTKKPFIETLSTMEAIFAPDGVTNFSSVADYLKQWVDEDPGDKARRIEIIQSYPVWMMISDGDLNSAGTPGGSMDQFKNKMLQWFGAAPVIVVWDILSDSTHNTTYFENIENVVHFAGVNPGIINQLFCNIDNLTVIDIYTQLNTLYQTNRYEPVKALTIGEVFEPKLISAVVEAV